MKRIIAIIMAVSMLTTALAQGVKGSWDEKAFKYTNSFHKITWALPSEIAWTKIAASTPSICFKAVNYESGVMLILNIKEDQKYGNDAWTMYADMNSTEYKDYLKKSSRAAGVTLLSTDSAKSQLDGIHAIKKTSLIRKNDPALGGEVDILDITYLLCKDDKLYSVDMQAPNSLKSEVEGFDQIVNMIFKGVKFFK